MDTRDTSQQFPEITGDWVAVDNTTNRMELAPTENPLVLATRNSFARDKINYHTKDQIVGLANAVRTGQLAGLGISTL